MLPDWNSTATDAIEAQDQQKLTEEQLNWRREATAFWKARTAAAAAERSARRPQKHRQKAFQWLLATDSAMQAVSGFGYKDFVLPPEGSQGPDSRYPCISLSICFTLSLHPCLSADRF